MTCRVNATLDAPRMPSAEQCGVVAVSLASTVAGALRRAARALAATLAWRERRGDWQTAARERYLAHAVDLSDLERRQRAWDRDESNSWSMSGWS